MVMYLGKVAEVGPAEAIFSAPRHPYTEALLASMPSMDPDRRTHEAPLSGDPPNPINPPPGCRFHTAASWSSRVCARTPSRRSTTWAADISRACHMANPASGHPRLAAA